MNFKRLFEILSETTVQLRKGAEVEESREGNVQVTEIYAMPHESEAKDGIAKVDCHFLIVGVDKEKAEKVRDELVEILREWPTEAFGQPTALEDGPSYLLVGGVLGDQGTAFQLFALGSVLGFWEIITPKKFGQSGDIADQLAGLGMIMIDGYNPN